MVMEDPVGNTHHSVRLPRQPFVMGHNNKSLPHFAAQVPYQTVQMLGIFAVEVA
jgi:hypothetical protein